MSVIFNHDHADLLDLLEGMLKRAEVKDRKSKAKQLLQEIEVSVSLYVFQKAARFQHGEVRTSLLKLWKAAEKGEGKQILLDLLSSSAPGTIEYLETRAERLWPSLELGPMFQSDLLTWAARAAEEDIKTVLIRCCAEGRQPIKGRKRPNGKRSKCNYEPVILGSADGADGPRGPLGPIFVTNFNFWPAPKASNAGRSSIDAEVELIMHLANDWYRITGTFETGGNSDESPLVEFITSVFRWAKIPNVNYALRVYWAELKARKARSAPDILPSPNGGPLPDTPTL